MNNLKTSFNNLFKKEPQKSFEELEITDERGFLSVDGTEIFNKWLLEKNKDKFYEEIVKPMKDKIKKDKK